MCENVLKYMNLGGKKDNVLNLPGQCTQRQAGKESPRHTAQGNAIYLGAGEPYKCTHLNKMACFKVLLVMA